jgi:hypothetical protein
MMAYLRLDYKHYDARYLYTYGWYDDFPARVWRYQQCTELGMFNGPHPSYPYSSTLLTKENYADYCKRIFGDELPSLNTTKVPQINMDDIENVLLTSQTMDPWQYATLRNSTSEGVKTVYIDCYPDCTYGIDVYADYTDPEKQPEALM